MFSPGQPSSVKPTSYDAPYVPRYDLRWFEGVLLMSGYRPYRLTPDNGIGPLIVWAQPVVAMKGWSKVATTDQERRVGWNVERKDVPEVEYIMPDLSRIAVGKVEPAPGEHLSPDAIILTADDDGGQINFLGNIIEHRELLSVQ